GFLRHASTFARPFEEEKTHNAATDQELRCVDNPDVGRTGRRSQQAAAPAPARRTAETHPSQALDCASGSEGECQAASIPVDNSAAVHDLPHRIADSALWKTNTWGGTLDTTRWMTPLRGGTVQAAPGRGRARRGGPQPRSALLEHARAGRRAPRDQAGLHQPALRQACRDGARGSLVLDQRGDRRPGAADDRPDRAEPLGGLDDLLEPGMQGERRGLEVVVEGVGEQFEVAAAERLELSLVDLGSLRRHPAAREHELVEAPED